MATVAEDRCLMPVYPMPVRLVPGSGVAVIVWPLALRPVMPAVQPGETRECWLCKSVAYWSSRNEIGSSADVFKCSVNLPAVMWFV